MRARPAAPARVTNARISAFQAYSSTKYSASAVPEACLEMSVFHRRVVKEVMAGREISGGILSRMKGRDDVILRRPHYSIAHT